MEIISYKGKKLQHIEDINDFIDEDGNTTCDLFNSKGALLALKGKTPREKIFHVAVYTYQDVYNKFQLSKKPWDIEKGTAEQNSRDLIKEELKQSVGENIVKTYEQASKAVTRLIDGKPITEKKLKTADELIDETLKLDHVKLHSCVSKLRTKDSYTFDHSFSVSILMAQALEDFTEFMDEDKFWDTFKTISGKVNFSKNGIRRYCVGALMHDYGKTLIPDEILNKPDKLTPKEFEIIKKHPSLGTEALKKSNVNDPQVLEIVGNHHAAYLTYPERGQSPLAQICNIIDVYDACRSKRVYKDAFDIEKVNDILKREYIKCHWNSFIFNRIINKTIINFEFNKSDKSK